MHKVSAPSEMSRRERKKKKNEKNFATRRAEIVPLSLFSTFHHIVLHSRRLILNALELKGSLKKTANIIFMIF